MKVTKEAICTAITVLYIPLCVCVCVCVRACMCFWQYLLWLNKCSTSGHTWGYNMCELSCVCIGGTLHWHALHWHALHWHAHCWHTHY